MTDAEFADCAELLKTLRPQLKTMTTGANDTETLFGSGEVDEAVRLGQTLRRHMHDDPGSESLVTVLTNLVGALIQQGHPDGGRAGPWLSTATSLTGSDAHTELRLTLAVQQGLVTDRQPP